MFGPHAEFIDSKILDMEWPYRGKGIACRAHACGGILSRYSKTSLPFGLVAAIRSRQVSNRFLEGAFTASQ